MKMLRSVVFVMASLLMSSVCAGADAEAPATSLIRVMPAAGMDTGIVARVAAFCTANTQIESRVDAAKDLAGDTLEERAQAASSLKKEGDFALVVLTFMPAAEKRHGYVDPVGHLMVINVTPMKATEDAEVYGRRLERQVMRGVYTLLGQGPCPNPFCCMHPYKEMKDLDRLGRNACPPCAFKGQQAARKAGVKLKKPTLPKGAMPGPGQ